MGRPICRPWPRRPRRRRSRGETGRRALLLAGLAGIAAALLVICAVNARVRPVTEELALAKLNNAVTAIVNQAVEEAMASGAVSYSDIVTLQTDLSSGIPRSLLSSESTCSTRSPKSWVRSVFSLMGSVRIAVIPPERSV